MRVSGVYNTYYLVVMHVKYLLLVGGALGSVRVCTFCLFRVLLAVLFVVACFAAGRSEDFFVIVAEVWRDVFCSSSRLPHTHPPPPASKANF